MKTLMQKLSRELSLSEIDFRVGAVFGNASAAYCRLLAYKDARVDMRILDEVTEGMWQNEYKRDSKGVLQCGIGILVEDQWIWKWSNGVESNMESEKGEYSDAFKRAGFMWGIGRDLYDFPELFFKLNPDEFKMSGNNVKANPYGKNGLKLNKWQWQAKGGYLFGYDQNGAERIKTAYGDGIEKCEPTPLPRPQSADGEHKIVAEEGDYYYKTGPRKNGETYYLRGNFNDQQDIKWYNSREEFAAVVKPLMKKS